jgi:hypothetical protein
MESQPFPFSSFLTYSSFQLSSLPPHQCPPNISVKPSNLSSLFSKPVLPDCQQKDFLSHPKSRHLDTFSLILKFFNQDPPLGANSFTRVLRPCHEVTNSTQGPLRKMPGPPCSGPRVASLLSLPRGKISPTFLYPRTSQTSHLCPSNCSLGKPGIYPFVVYLKPSCFIPQHTSS